MALEAAGEVPSAEGLAEKVEAATRGEDRGPSCYFALYLAADSSIAKVPDLAAFEALLLLHRTRWDGHEGLVTYWRTRDDWSADNPRFCKETGTKLSQHGVVRDLKTPTKPIWKKVKLHTWLLGLAAFLGALEAVGNHYDWLFAPSSLTAKVQSTESLAALDSGDFVASVLASNQSSLEQREIDFSLPTLQSADDESRVELEAEPAHLERLRPGSSAEIRVSGKAPKAGRYTFSVDVLSKAGLLRGLLMGPTHFPLRYPARIWPSLPVTVHELQPETDGWTSVDATLTVGLEEPRGVDCLLFIRRHRTDETPILDYTGSTNKRWTADYAVAGQEKELLEWHGSAIGAHRDLRFRVSVPDTQGIDPDVLNKNLSLTCFRAKED